MSSGKYQNRKRRQLSGATDVSVLMRVPSILDYNEIKLSDTTEAAVEKKAALPKFCNQETAK